MKKYLIVPVLILAAALRLYKLNMPYWVDELVTRERGSGTFWEACTRSTQPVNDVIAWFTTRIWDAEWMLRTPSMLAGVAGVAAIYGLGKRAHGRAAGFFAALLLAVSVFHIEHSQDARYYAFVMLITILSIKTLLRAGETPASLSPASSAPASSAPASLAAFAGLTALGVSTHPFYVLAVAGMVLGYGAWLFLGSGLPALRSRLKAAFWVGISAGVGCLPLLLFSGKRLIGGLAGIGGGDALNEEAAAPAQALYRLAAGEYRAYVWQMAGGGWFAWVVLALMVVGLVALYRRKSPLAFMAVFFFLMPLPLLFIDVKHWYDNRYFAWQLPVMLMAAGVGIGWIVEAVAARRRVAGACLGILAAALVVLDAVPSLRDYYRAHCPRDNWGQVAEYISGRMTEGDVVFHASTYSMETGSSHYRSRVLEYYLDRRMPPGNRKCWTSRSGAEPPSLLDAVSEFPGKSLWIAADRARITPELSGLIAELCGEPLMKGTPSLYVLGEPTKNLVVCGGFEEPLQRLTLAEGTALAPAEIAGGGSQCLCMENNEPDKHANVVLAVVQDAAGAVLQDGETYTLSMELKIEDVRQGSNPSRVCKVALAGRDAAGEAFWRELLLLRGTEDWRRYVMRIVAGQEVPAGAREMTVRVGLFGGTGRVWVDNVQLERKAYPTPFVQGERVRESAVGG